MGLPIRSPTFQSFIAPLDDILPAITPLMSRSNRSITFTFDYQLKSLIYYHLEECTSAQALLQMMVDDEFARQNLIPEKGLGESTFYEANANRGAIQMLEVFDQLGRKVSLCISNPFAKLGDLVAIDGSLIDAALSMTWADYSTNANKVKVHIGLSLCQNCPRRIALTTGNRRLRQLRWQIRRETGAVYPIRVETHLQVTALLIFPNISYDQDDHKKC